MFRFLKDSPKGETELTQYVNAWKESRQEDVDLLCEHARSNLDALDAKAGGLIASSSLFCAIFTFLAFMPKEYTLELTNFPGFRFACLLALLISMVSLGFSMSVINVYWTTIDEYKNRGSAEDRAKSLIRIRSERTNRYRVSFAINFVLLGACFLLLLVNLLAKV